MRGVAGAIALILATAAVIPPRPAAAAPVRRLLLECAEAGSVTVRPAPPPAMAPGLGEGPVTIEVGPNGRLVRQGSQIEATGGATIIQGAARLTAERATAELESGEIIAEGNVVFTTPGHTVRGERIEYNTDTRQARAAVAETVVDGVIVRGRSIDATEAEYIVTGASITTCDRPRPHYQLTARTVTVVPNDRIVARHVGIWLFGQRLLVVPTVTMRIGVSRGQGGGSLFPRLGSNSRDGFYVGKVLPLLDDPRLYVDFDGRLSTRRALTGGFDAAAPAGASLQVVGALKYRDIAPNQRTTFLEVDRLPEVGVVWVSPRPAPRARRRRSPRRRARRLAIPPARAGGAPAAEVPEPGYRPLAPVGEDVEHQPGLLHPPTPRRWYLRAQATVGYFHQRESSIFGGVAESLSHSRLDLRATASRSGLRIAGLALPVLQFFARHSFYDNGSSYNVFGIGAQQQWRLRDHWAGALRAFFHQTGGRTPFSFDQVEIRTELQPALSYTAGGTTLSWLGRLDVDRGQLFDQEYSIARVFDCLEPRLSYLTRRRQISLDVRIIGLDLE